MIKEDFIIFISQNDSIEFRYFNMNIAMRYIFPSYYFDHIFSFLGFILKSRSNLNVRHSLKILYNLYKSLLNVFYIHKHELVFNFRLVQ